MHPIFGLAAAALKRVHDALFAYGRGANRAVRAASIRTHPRCRECAMISRRAPHRALYTMDVGRPRSPDGAVMRRLVLLRAVICAALLAGCGSESPTAPSSESGSASALQEIWAGTWVRNGCSESGGAVGAACNATPTTGAFRLNLTQSGGSAQGTVEVGAFTVPLSGSVSNNGTVTLSGNSRLPQGATATVSDWSTRVNGNTMTGSFTLRIVPDDSAFGTQTLQVSLQNVTKSS